jgi:predicted esterase
MVARPATAQDHPTRDERPAPELLWHESTALFPIRVHLPEDFDAAKTYPAVIALHGFGGSSERFDSIGRAFARAGFIAVLPEGPYPVPYLSADSVRRSTWELSTWTEEYGLGPPLSGDPAIEERSKSITLHEYLPSVMDRVQEQYRVDPLYFFGFSLGGVYALVAAFYHRDRCGGVVAFGVAGIDREWFTDRGESLENGNDLAVRLGLGRSDPMIPFSAGERVRDVLKEAGYPVVLDDFSGGHAVPDDALQRAVDWLRDLSENE